MIKKDHMEASQTRKQPFKLGKAMLPFDPTSIEDFERGSNKSKNNWDDNSNEHQSSDDDENDYMDIQ